MENGKYRFKPRYDIKSRSELLELLRKHFNEGLENILLSDVLESYRKGEVAVKRLESEKKLVRIVRKRDQNTILIYNHTSDLFDNLGGNSMVEILFRNHYHLDCSLFINVFHTINIETVSMDTIEDKLQIESVKSEETEKKQILKKPVVSRRKPRKVVIRTNASLADTLKY